MKENFLELLDKFQQQISNLRFLFSFSFNLDFHKHLEFLIHSTKRLGFLNVLHSTSSDTSIEREDHQSKERGGLVSQMDNRTRFESGKRWEKSKGLSWDGLMFPLNLNDIH